MHLGISTMNNLHIMRTDDLARKVEDRGYESLWMGEHSHVPVVSTSTYPSGGDYYKHIGDPFVSIATAAAAAKKLRFGISVCLVLEREIFNLAKEIATLDQLSNGRLMIAAGVGWHEEEFNNVARMSWKKRYSGAKECVAALRALWTQDEAEFHGEWYDFDKVWSYPKPFQKPYPPIGLGVMGKVGVAMAAEWGDIWVPFDFGTRDFGPRLERFRQMVRDGGRDPDKVEVSVGNLGQIAPDTLRRYRDVGVDRAIINCESDGTEAGKMEAFLDRFAKLNDELR